MTETTQRLWGADFITASACVLVLVNHLAQRADVGSVLGAYGVLLSLSNVGGFAIATLMVLIGFIQARPFWQALSAGDPLPSPRAFAIGRAARILPAFWVALTVSFIASITIFDVVADGWLWLRYLSGLLLIAPWHWSTLFPVEINVPLWAIGFLGTSYALFTFGFWMLKMLTKRRGRGHDTRLLWMAVIATTLTANWLFISLVGVAPSNDGMAFGLQEWARSKAPWFNPFSFFAMFAIGVLAAGVQVQVGRQHGWRFDIIAMLAISAAAAMIWSAKGPNSEAFYGWLHVPYEFPLFHLVIGVILAVTPSTRVLGPLMDNRVFRYLANLTLGIYLWHYLVLELVHFYWAPEFSVGGMSDPTKYFAYCGLVIVLSLLLATLSYYLLEQPMVRWAARRMRLAPRCSARPALSSALRSTSSAPRQS